MAFNWSWNCEGTSILLDTIHEIMVNKLCTLLSRSEIRDLIDLDLGLKHAAQKDGGFSALTLAWVLEKFPLQKLATVAGISAEETLRLDQFRLDLIKRLTSQQPFSG